MRDYNRGDEPAAVQKSDALWALGQLKTTKSEDWARRMLWTINEWRMVEELGLRRERRAAHRLYDEAVAVWNRRFPPSCGRM